MAEFIVHTIPGSPFARAVLATLEEKGASYRVAPLAPGAVRQPEHLSRHPFGRMPVLDHNGFILYETQAILRYLDRILSTPPLTPAHPQAAARMDQLLNINDWYLFPSVGVIGFQRVVGPKLFGRVPDEAAIAAEMPQARIVIDELARLLGAQTFFAGVEVSLADLMLAAQLDFLTQTPEWPQLTAAHPQLAAWATRIETRPSQQATTWDRVVTLSEQTDQQLCHADVN